jgi:hypothetical protein
LTGIAWWAYVAPVGRILLIVALVVYVASLAEYAHADIPVTDGLAWSALHSTETWEARIPNATPACPGPITLAFATLPRNAGSRHNQEAAEYSGGCVIRLNASYWTQLRRVYATGDRWRMENTLLVIWSFMAHGLGHARYGWDDQSGPGIMNADGSFYAHPPGAAYAWARMVLPHRTYARTTSERR